MTDRTSNKRTEVSAPDSLDWYFRLMTFNGAARVYHTARDVGIFEALNAGALSAADVARTCGTKEHPTALLLDSLCALGVIEEDTQRYSLTATAHLLVGDARDLGDRYWEYLSQFLRTGTPLLRMEDPGHCQDYYQRQVETIGHMMSPAARAAADTLDIGGGRKDLHILDVGAGSAVWSLTFARRDPGARVTALDWPAVLEVATRAAHHARLTRRFSTLPGNYKERELPAAAYDMAIVGNVAHLNSPEDNTSLFRKLHLALRPQGEIVIIDVFRDDTGQDLARTLYALGLAIRTTTGKVYASQELSTLLMEAGFQHGTLHNLEAPPFAMGLLVASKRR